MAHFQERITNVKREIAVVACVMVAARSKAWVCSRSLAGIVGSNPAGGLDIFLLWMCFVRQRSLLQADPEESYRVCVCVCVIGCDQVQQ
jgi:hypothetical protein